MRHLKILIDDDCAASQDFYRETLEEETNEFLVRYLKREDFLWSTIKIWEPDLIVLRDSFYSEDKKELLNLIRCHPKTSRIPILVVGAGPLREKDIEAIESWADVYLVEPLHKRIFLANTRALLRRANALPLGGQTLKLGNLCVDLEESQVTVDQRNISLSHKEYELFLIFALRPKRILKDIFLWETVWGEDKPFHKHALEDSLSRLRQALGPMWSPCFLYHRDFGYSFDPDLYKRSAKSNGKTNKLGSWPSQGSDLALKVNKKNGFLRRLSSLYSLAIGEDGINGRHLMSSQFSRLTSARCVKILRQARWPNGVNCPYCGRQEIRLLAKTSYRGFCRRYLCKACSRQQGCNVTFTDKTGTIFEGSKIPLNKWLFLVHLCLQHKDHHSPSDCLKIPNGHHWVSQRLLCRTRSLIAQYKKSAHYSLPA